MGQVKLFGRCPGQRTSADRRRKSCASCSRGRQSGKRRANVKIGKQTADILVEFNMGESHHTLVLETTSLGQPREIRGAHCALDGHSSGTAKRLPDCRFRVHQPPKCHPPQAERPRIPRSLGQLLSFLRQRADREGGQAESPAVHPATQIPLRAPSDPRRSCPPGRSPARVAARGACQDGGGRASGMPTT